MAIGLGMFRVPDVVVEIIDHETVVDVIAATGRHDNFVLMVVMIIAVWIMTVVINA